MSIKFVDVVIFLRRERIESVIELWHDYLVYDFDNCIDNIPLRLA
jgi:hypothetical protein